jgi:hypothetical protein
MPDGEIGEAGSGMLAMLVEPEKGSRYQWDASPR